MRYFSFLAARAEGGEGPMGGDKIDVLAVLSLGTWFAATGACFPCAYLHTLHSIPYTVMD